MKISNPFPQRILVGFQRYWLNECQNNGILDRFIINLTVKAAAVEQIQVEPFVSIFRIRQTHLIQLMSI